MSGVPQGSILGPILYLIYSEDMKMGISNCIRAFVDDTMISATAGDVITAARMLQSDIRLLEECALRWKTNLNGTGGVHSFLLMDGQLVREVSSHKHLGVVLSHDGRWTDHINSICSSACKRINVMRQYYKTFAKKSLLYMYRAFIRPKF